MKILHTSDWHLGHSLFGKKRHEEFQAFLDWLADTVCREQVDVLLVAGDVFDSAFPGTAAQTLYFRLLRRLSDASSPCRHVVITAGNHDSPSFLDAPAPLLKAFDIHVTGNAGEPEDEVLTLCDGDGRPELIVCAVPFLRDRDLYRASPGDTFEERDSRLADGMREHYRRCAEEAERRRAECGDIPVVAMGHLFAAGGNVTEDGGVRDLRVGSLGQTEASVFPAGFDYVALGHLHISQRVHGEDRIRYSGSPLPMGFGEAGQQKEVLLLEARGRRVSATPLPVPTFQRLEKLSGSREELEHALAQLSRSGENVWVEAVHTGTAPASDLAEALQAAAGPNVEILRIRNAAALSLALEAASEDEELQSMDAVAVFERLLEDKFPHEDRQSESFLSLRRTYREALQDVLDASREED